jgi:hypothetical protein
MTPTRYALPVDDYDFEREQRGREVRAPARVTLDPPVDSLPASVVSAGELGISYKVLEDWSDD